LFIGQWSLPCTYIISEMNSFAITQTIRGQGGHIKAFATITFKATENLFCICIHQITVNVKSKFMVKKAAT